VFNLPVKENKILNLILENLFTVEINPPADFRQTIDFLKSLFDSIDNLNFNDIVITEIIKPLNQAACGYLLSENIDMPSLIALIADNEKKITTGNTKKETSRHYFEFIDYYQNELKNTIKSAIKRKIEYDSRNCSQLVSEVFEKINLFYSEFHFYVSKVKKTNSFNQFQKLHDSITENYNKFKLEIIDFFNADNYCELIYSSDKSNNRQISLFENNIKYLNLKPVEIINLSAATSPFSFELLNYNQKQLLMINLLFDYPDISFLPLNYLFIIEITGGNCENCLTKQYSQFIKIALNNLQTSNLNISFEFENKIQNIFTPVINHLNLVLNKNENINILVQSILKEIQNVFKCDFTAMSFIDSATGNFSFLCSYDSQTDSSNDFKNFINGDEQTISSILKECIFNKKIIISEDINTQIKLNENFEGPSTIKSVMFAPIYNSQRNIGVILLFSKKQNNFYIEHKLAFKKLREYIANAINNLTSYNCLKNDMSTLKMMQNQIINSEKLKLLSEVATGIAHNFNNLLAIILGRVGLLQRGIKDIKHLSSLKIIEDTIKDGEQMIKKIQSFMAKKTDISNYSAANIGRILKNALEYTLVRAKVEEYLKGININIKLEIEEVSETYANAEELHEVFINLTFNAIEAMPAGGELIVRLSQSREDDCLLIAIIDNGIGMSVDTQHKIFTPFFTTKGQLGTGLGLSYSYGAILRHKGTISFESAPGKGTEFIIKLPVLKKTLDISNYKSTCDVSLKKSRILIVDDDEQVRSALNDIMLILGHDVVSVCGGEEAIEILTNDINFDFIFTDLKMPKVSGFEVVKFIKKKEPSIFVGIITAYGSNNDSQEFKDVRADAIIGKPFNIKMIENIMIDALKNKKQKK